jgi:hypothetical protein
MGEWLLKFLLAPFPNMNGPMEREMVVNDGEHVYDEKDS